jgi:hypothetical protein
MKSWLKDYQTKQMVKAEIKLTEKEIKVETTYLAGLKEWLKLLKSHERALNKSK